MSREHYQKRLGELKKQLAETEQSGMSLTLDERRALDLLRHVPALLAAGTPEHLRQLAAAVFSRIWVEERSIVAVTPRAELYPLLVARSIHQGWSEDQPRSVHGVPDGARTHNFLIHSQALCH